MKNKFVVFSTLITFIALLFFFGVSVAITQKNNEDHAKEEIIDFANLCVSLNELPANYNNDRIRITIISSTGEVTYDNQYADLSAFDNHLNREEIIAAYINEPKVVTRSSDTINAKMMYYAVKKATTTDYVFIRIALPVSNINAYILNTIPLFLLIIFIAMTFSTILSILFSSSLLKPLKIIKSNLESINKGSYKSAIPHSSDDDVNKILVDIADLSDKVETNIGEIRDKELKLDSVVNNIADSIIAFDDNSKVVLANESAKTLFDVKNYLNKPLVQVIPDIVLLDKAVECFNKKADFFGDYSYQGRHYVIQIKNISEKLFLIVFTDITEARNNEKVRSEFFANASHELKTPLTSIRGFNELIEISNKDENLLPYISKISLESNRMLKLIEDMLKISKYENQTDFEKVPLDLNQISSEVISSLDIQIKSKNINVKLEGNATLNGSKDHFYELAKNLIENSVKYNNDGGNVRISIDNRDDKVIYSVSDDGIGIAPENQQRIFERFYRVEKSRSRETGGTGLGLAIVKHIAELYSAQISLSSSLGNGTTITLVFPKSV